MTSDKSIVNSAPVNHIVSLLFETPSTRTKFGFEVAAHSLGARAISLDGATSRLASGESMEDSLHTLFQMTEEIADQIAVVRTRQALNNIDLTNTCVVNAGDAHEHPTQALVDLFTIATLMKQDLANLTDFTLYCCAGQGALLRPIVSLAWLLDTLGIGKIVLYSETALPDLELPRVIKVGGWSPEATAGPAFGYLIESFDDEGNLRRSDWVVQRIKELSALPCLHPLPRLEADELAIRDESSDNPVALQLNFQIPVKRAVLSWLRMAN